MIKYKDWFEDTNRTTYNIWPKKRNGKHAPIGKPRVSPLLSLNKIRNQPKLRRVKHTLDSHRARRLYQCSFFAILELSVLQFTASEYHFGIFNLFICRTTIDQIKARRVAPYTPTRSCVHIGVLKKNTEQKNKFKKWKTKSRCGFLWKFNVIKITALLYISICMVIDVYMFL